MKLIKTHSNLTEEDVDILFESLSFYEKKYMYDIYIQFDFVEYMESDKTGGVFCIIDDWCFNKISEFYKLHEIKFTSIDLSNDAFMDNYIETNYFDDCVDVTKDIEQLILKFKSNYTNADVVLDKILEKGIDSLNEFDKSFLV
jgi:hypothetical protein